MPIVTITTEVSEYMHIKNKDGLVRCFSPHCSLYRIPFPTRMSGGSQPPKLQLQRIRHPFLTFVGSCIHLYISTHKYTEVLENKMNGLEFVLRVLFIATSTVCELELKFYNTV